MKILINADILSAIFKSFVSGRVVKLIYQSHVEEIINIECNGIFVFIHTNVKRYDYSIKHHVEVDYAIQL